MFNCSELVADKTGLVLFVRKNNEIQCSETWETAHRLIFRTKATVEYIDLDNEYTTTKVDAKADAANFAFTLYVPCECGNDGKLLEITYSKSGGITVKETAGIPKGTVPYQQLVTDVNGNATWSNTPYIGEAITISHSGDFTKAPIGSSGAATTAICTNQLSYKKMSDMIPPIDDLFSDAVEFHFTNNDTGEPITTNKDSKYVFDGAYGRWGLVTLPYRDPNTEDGLPPIVLVVTEVPFEYKIAGNGTFDYNFTEPGVYMAVGTHGKKAGRVEFTYYHGTPIDKAVPIIQTAQVGQTIVVKSVDENGKPTEWEAADMAAGGSGGNSIIVIARSIDDDIYECNMDYDKVAAMISDMTVASGLLRIDGDDTLYYIESFGDYRTANTPCVSMTFRNIFVTESESLKVYYKSDGTLTGYNPNGK